jgi:hypothetical protein
MILRDLNVRLPDHVGRSPAEYCGTRVRPGEIWRVPWGGRSLLYYIVGGRLPCPAWNLDVVRVDPRGHNQWSCISVEFLSRGRRVR